MLLNGDNLLTLGGFLGLRRCIIGGKRRSLLAQAVDLLRQAGQLGALSGFILGRCKCPQLGFQGGQVVTGGKSIQLGCQSPQVFCTRLIRAGEFVGPLAQGSQLLLNGGNLHALGAFLSLCRCIIGGQGRGLLAQGLDLLCQSGQLGTLSSFILRRRKGSQLRLQGRELVGLFLLIGIGFPVGILQGCHTYLIRVPCGGVLTKAPLDGDDVDHQENDDCEEGQGDGPIE